MDVSKILEELNAELSRVQFAIESLQQLELSRTHRRGRPPAWLTEARRRGRPPGSKNKIAEVAEAEGGDTAAA